MFVSIECAESGMLHWGDASGKSYRAPRVVAAQVRHVRPTAIPGVAA